MVQAIAMVVAEWRENIQYPCRKHKGYIQVSATNKNIKRYCCVNCSRHHWGEYYQVGGYEYKEWDFDYCKPNGDPYYCKARRHILRGGPEYCMGRCYRCYAETRQPGIPLNDND